MREMIRAAFQVETYLSKSTLADASEENKVEEIDVAVKIYRLYKVTARFGQYTERTLG